MKRFLTIAFLLALPWSTVAQTKTTQSLSERYEESKAAFFYKNTLRMINQTEDKEFDELIDGIEKAKLVIIDKSQNFKESDYKTITTDYMKESFEPAMTSRSQGRSFDVYVKESGGKTKGIVVLVNDSSTLYVLDIVGSLALGKVVGAFDKLNETSDVAKMITDFKGRNDKKNKRKEDEEGDDH
jgi:hypothetical protein